MAGEDYDKPDRVRTVNFSGGVWVFLAFLMALVIADLVIGVVGVLEINDLRNDLFPNGTDSSIVTGSSLGGGGASLLTARTLHVAPSTLHTASSWINDCEADCDAEGESEGLVDNCVQACQCCRKNYFFSDILHLDFIAPPCVFNDGSREVACEA